MKFKVLPFVLFLISVISSQGQSLYVKDTNQIQTSFQISDIDKLSFSDGSLVVSKTNNSSESFELSSLRYVTFESLITQLNEPSIISDDFYCYPNPADNTLYFKIPKESKSNGVINIYSIEGILMASQQVSSDIVSIDISSFSNGIYFCRLISGLETQTTKVIKQ